MAKTKEEEEAGGRPHPKARSNNNNNKNIKDKNSDRNKKNLENGLYVHSSPPKALNSNSGHGSATIRDYIRAADIGSLEEVVLQGQGTKLVNQPATDPRVRNFLKTVPSYMSKIDLLHDAVEKGNLRELKALLDRRKLARSRDAHGVGLLHKAVVHDHRAIVDYLISDYPETLEVTDNEGRTALHYCAASNFPDDMYGILCDAVPDTQVQDNKGKTAADYMSNPRDLNVSRRRSHKGGSGGSKSKNRTPKKRGSPGQLRTPPKREGMNITGANIRIWIHDKDLSRLEQIVWEGQGHRLLKETSNNAKVRQFLNLVPRMMTKIKEVHQAALNGDLETLDAKVDQPDILIAKDHNGLNPLHKSAALGHKEISEWIVQKNQATIFAQDRKGRTPLFYAGVAKDGGEVYDMLLRSGSDPNHTDQYRKTAEHYRFRPNDLNVSIIHETPVAPRGGGGSTLDIPGPSNQNSRAPSRNNPGSRNPSRRNSTGSDKKGHSRKKKDGQSNHSSAKSDDMDFRDMKNVTDADIERYIREGDLDSLEDIILSGRGADLQGRSSWNDEVRRFLKKVPGYMEKITSLHDAAASGNMTNVRRLTKENGKLVMAKGKDGGVGLHYAARSGDPKITKYLLGLYPPAVDIDDHDGKSPLHYAALSQGKGAKETYELLKKEGASTSTTDLSGNTPEDYLHSAGMHHLNPDETFVSGRSPGRKSRAPSKSPSKGPSRAPSKSPSRAPSKSPAKLSPQNDPKASPKSPGKAPPKSPAKTPAKSPAKAPPKSPAKAPPKSPAKGPAKDANKGNATKDPSKNKPSKSNLSREPSKDNISKAPSKGPSPNPSRAGSRAPTPSVVNNGTTDKEIQAAILAAEKDENYKPLTDIIIRGDGEKLVGKKSKDPEVDEYLKKVPQHLAAIEELHEAVEDGETRKVMNLLDKKQKAYVKDSHQANILHKAVLYGHTDLVRYLVSSFPDLMKQEDMAGRTPLHYAAVIRDGGHIYKILEKEGADDDLKDNSGHTPKDYKNNQQLLTQWDLMRELKDGTADSQLDSKGRPVTKGSIDSPKGNGNNAPKEDGKKDKKEDGKKDQKQDGKNDQKENGKITPNPKENGKITPDPKENGKLTPNPKENGKTTPDPKDSGKTTPNPKENGKITPNPKENGKVTPDPKENGRLTPNPKENGKVTPDPKESGKTTPNPKDNGKVTPDPKESGKTTPKPKENGKITPIPNGNKKDDDDDDDDDDDKPPNKNNNKKNGVLNPPVVGGLQRRGSNASVDSEFPGMWSDEGQYLTNALGDALIKGLSDVNKVRPKDPIAHLACSLYNYRYNKPVEEADPKNDKKQGSSGSGGSGHSTIAMQTAVNSTGGNAQPTTPQTRDKNGQSVLHFAAARPHGRSAFYRLIEESNCSLAERDEKYRTPRDVASEKGLKENVRAIDKYVITLAAEGHLPELKNLLIDGYDHIADIEDENGNNIHEVAQKNRQYKTVEFLRSVANFEERVDWLHKAIRVGSLPHVQYIADHEEIARARDERGRTSLHIATLCEEKEIMEFLATKYPVLLKIGDNLERTPLHYAMAVEGVDQVAKVLVQAGARRAVKDLRGKQPSYYFMNRGDVVEMIKEVMAEA